MALTATIVTVGSELTQGLRVDTNTAEIARALAPRGFHVVETLSVGDDEGALAAELGRLSADRDLIITTGGLGPTHDDITRGAASQAFGLPLSTDPRIVELLEPVKARHIDPVAAEQVLVQAQVLQGAEVIDFVTGTAPGQVLGTSSRCVVALLPGPPAEMRPMLARLLERYELVAAQPRELGVVGLHESDAQVLVERAIAGTGGVGFTILARPGDVRVILTDQGGGADRVDMAAELAASALADRCYSTDGSTLAQVVVGEAAIRNLTLAVAESCTGGMVAAALTDVPGASSVFKGGIVSYADRAKMDLLDVPAQVLAANGAVSAETVERMALGAYSAFHGPDVVVAVTGIAGPDGGTAEKPVGTVWFGVLTSRLLAPHSEGSEELAGVQFKRSFPSTSREAVRSRATSVALDTLRRAVLGLELPK